MAALKCLQRVFLVWGGAVRVRGVVNGAQRPVAFKTQQDRGRRCRRASAQTSRRVAPKLSASLLVSCDVWRPERPSFIKLGNKSSPTRVTHTLFALCVLHLTFLSVILSALAARRGRRRPPRDRTEACLPCGGCSRGQHCVQPSWPRRFPDHRHRRRSLPLLLQRTHCRNCGGILNWMRHTCAA